MMGNIASIIGSLLVNVFSSFAYEAGKGFSAHQRAKQDEEKINQWIENFLFRLAEPHSPA